MTDTLPAIRDDAQDAVSERLLTTQSPQRPQVAPAFSIEIDGRQLTGRAGQTILEVCRDNGIEVPTLCYEPKLPGFGACRMCVVEVEGEATPPISCSRAAEPEMTVRTQTPRLREVRKTNLELIFSDHNAYCLPPCQNKCPSHIDIPGFLKANTEGNFIESARIFKRTIPFPSVLGRVCPAPCEEHCRRDEVEEAIAIRDSHRYAGDQVLRAQAAGMKAPVPFEVQPASGKRAAVIGSGPAGMAAAYYLAIAGHEVTVFERDPAAGGMLRYGIPQYRLPKVEVLEAEYQGAWDLGVKLVSNAELGKDFTISDLQNQGFDAVCVAIGCYDTNKLGVPGEDAEGVLDGLEYLRIATLGLPYPGHAGTRVVVIGGGFTSMDCSRTSIRQGAKEVTLVYRRDMKDMPAANEVHEMIEEGARAIFQAAPTRVVTDANNKVTGVEFQRMALGAPDASGRRRPEPMAGTEFVIDCDRVLLAIGQGPDLTWTARGADGVTANKQRRLAADAVTFATVAAGRLRHRRRAYRRGHRGAGRGRGPSRGVRHGRLPQGHGPRGHPHPPDAGRAAARVPVHRALHAGGQGAAAAPQGDARRGAQQQLHRVRDPLHAAGGDVRIGALPAVHLRGHRLLRPAPPGHRVRHDAQDARAGAHRDQLPQRLGEPLHGHQPRLPARRQPRLHPARALALHRLRPLRQRLQGGGRRRLLRLHAHRLRHPRDHAAGHEPQHHAVRLLRPLRRDLPHRRADAQAARAREVRGRREPLHPVRHLRRRLPLRRAALRTRLRALPRQPRRSR